MKRSMGVGDFLICGGLSLMFIFLIVGLITNIVTDEASFGWEHVTSIVLMLLMCGGGFLLFMSLSRGDVRILNIHYALSGFMLLLHIKLVGVPSYAGCFTPLSFYVFLGALLLGVGVYMAQTGIDFFKIGGDKTEKKAE